MNIKQFFKKTIRRLRREPEFTDGLVNDMIRRLQITNEEELSCDELFSLIDVYAEADLRGEDIERLEPLIRQHLDMCRECEEEYEALLEVLENVGSE